MPSVAVIVFSAAVVLTAYVIFGISGFGSTLIAAPLLAQVYPIKFVIPMIVLLDCIGAISMGVRLRADVNKAELTPLLPFLAAGLLLGAFLLLRVPAALLVGGLGIVVAAYGAFYASGRQPRFRVPRWSAAPVGLFAGVTSSMFGIGGPIYVMYLTARGSTPENVRATVPVIFIFTTIARIAIFAVAGLFTAEVLYTAASLLPLMVLGMWAGHHLHLNMTREQIVRVMGVLLVVSGGSLLVRALAA
jgi:uncharacterized membrane protein YfcA